MPSFLTAFGTAVITKNGYVRLLQVPYRNRYLHRVVWETLACSSLPESWEVHHMDGNRRHNCPENLLATLDVLHPATQGLQRRCPLTGRFLSQREWEMLYPNEEVPF